MESEDEDPDDSGADISDQHNHDRPEDKEAAKIREKQRRESNKIVQQHARMRLRNRNYTQAGVDPYNQYRINTAAIVDKIDRLEQKRHNASQRRLEELSRFRELDRLRENLHFEQMQMQMQKQARPPTPPYDNDDDDDDDDDCSSSNSKPRGPQPAPDLAKVEIPGEGVQPMPRTKPKFRFYNPRCVHEAYKAKRRGRPVDKYNRPLPEDPEPVNPVKKAA
ncbi:hypothetical protein SCUCBS95973_002007 [Sporothrix curviconia]|uniref:Uncharacterized protein n=1 Tax=Sporothrix curviconia TaxID=1260050 RepID=A0ABP0B3Z2_9PEZI